MAKLVSKVYGDALYEIGRENQKLEQMRQDVAQIRAVFDRNDMLMKLLTHPQVTTDEKLQILDRIFKGKLEDEYLRFLEVLIEKRRLQELDQILAYVIEKIDEHFGIGTAYVTTAQEMGDVIKKQIEAKLLATSGFKQVHVVYEVDPSLIGGMVIRIGDRIMDSSVNTRIKEIKRGLYH